jgi:hypothetical protein
MLLLLYLHSRVWSCLFDIVLHGCFQKAHVQQFLATEDALNKAAEARDLCQKLLKRLHGTGDEVSSNSIVSGGTTQNMSSLKQFEVIAPIDLRLIVVKVLNNATMKWWLYPLLLILACFSVFGYGNLSISLKFLLIEIVRYTWHAKVLVFCCNVSRTICSSVLRNFSCQPSCS